MRLRPLLDHLDSFGLPRFVPLQLVHHIIGANDRAGQYHRQAFVMTTLFEDVFADDIQSLFNLERTIGALIGLRIVDENKIGALLRSIGTLELDTTTRRSKTTAHDNGAARLAPINHRQHN